jgi:hypothetical protein
VQAWFFVRPFENPGKNGGLQKLLTAVRKLLVDMLSTPASKLMTTLLVTAGAQKYSICKLLHNDVF